MRVFNDCSLVISAASKEQWPESDLPEIVLAGRSNVGKSSFINAMTNRKKLAYVGNTPGKTRLLNFFNLDNQLMFVDVPGYGYANVSKKQLQKFGLMIEEYLKNRPNLRHVFLLVDYRHKPSEDDKLMYNFLKYYNLPVTIVATKYDKVNRSLRAKQDDLIKNTLNPLLGDEIVNFSSVTKLGKERIYEIINNYLQ